MVIRPETTSDYAGIAEVQLLAFEYQVPIAAIVALHRQLRAFDPELSLVAEVDGRVVGHVLFSPQAIRLLDQDVRAVNLSPIGVHPAYQGRGIGGALIEEGHAVARAKGYALSFLVGHPTYYPRFGYLTHAYGASLLAVAMDVGLSGKLEARALEVGDIPALRDLWRREEHALDFSIDPGEDPLNWFSPNPSVQATVYLREGELVGYTRSHSARPQRPIACLAKDAAVAREMCATIAQGAGPEAPVKEVVLPLHPLSTSTQGLGEPESKAWTAAMACSLAPNPFDEYYEKVRAGERPIGRVVWPPIFDIAES